MSHRLLARWTPSCPKIEKQDFTLFVFDGLLFSSETMNSSYSLELLEFGCNVKADSSLTLSLLFVPLLSLCEHMSKQLWEEYHIEVGKLMTSELLGLGLLNKADVQNENKDWPAYKKYFMHGTSHHIGLDTHDYGLLHEPIQANMVFTVEPGIYIPDEGFGIRLEDDVVVQEKGEPFNLMGKIPIEADGIEDLMNS